MINVAFLNSSGEIQQWCSPGDDNQWPDGSMVGDLLIKHMDISINLTEFSKTHIWGYVEQAWITRTPKPNFFYDWENGEWTFKSDRFWDEVRRLRDGKLYYSDWTQLEDAPITQSKKLDWTNYRQALRDVPQNNLNATSIEEIQWPSIP